VFEGYSKKIKPLKSNQIFPSEPLVCYPYFKILFYSLLVLPFFPFSGIELNHVSFSTLINLSKIQPFLVFIVKEIIMTKTFECHARIALQIKHRESSFFVIKIGLNPK